MLNIHVLFMPDQPPLPDGSPSPLSNVGVILDDEIQYRCAGYIQAEIERYAEFLEEVDGSQQVSEVGSDEERNSDPEATPTKTRRPSRRGKQSVNQVQGS